MLASVQSHGKFFSHLEGREPAFVPPVSQLFDGGSIPEGVATPVSRSAEGKRAVLLSWGQL